MRSFKGLKHAKASTVRTISLPNIGKWYLCDIYCCYNRTLVLFFNNRLHITEIWIVLHTPYVTSVLRYFGPTRTRFFSSFKLLLVRCTVCWIHTSFKKFVYPTYYRSVAHYIEKELVYPTYYCRSVAQLSSVGCTLL